MENSIKLEVSLIGERVIEPTNQPSTKKCRACGIDKTKNKSLYETPDGFKNNLAKAFTACTGISVAQDDPVLDICIDCVLDLRNAFEFHERCIKTNENLKKLSKVTGTSNIKLLI